jgi:hypothetical protein
MVIVSHNKGPAGTTDIVGQGATLEPFIQNRFAANE